MSKIKLAYVIVDKDNIDTPFETVSHDIKTFNTKKAAQMYDRLLKETYGIDRVISKIIYDDDSEE